MTVKWNRRSKGRPCWKDSEVSEFAIILMPVVVECIITGADTLIFGNLNLTLTNAKIV
jgi:hypothetical protein